MSNSPLLAIPLVVHPLGFSLGHRQTGGLDQLHIRSEPQFRPQSRGGLGLINIKTSDLNGKVFALKSVQFADELMLITANGQIIRTGLDEIRAIGRNTQGVRLIKLREGDKLVAAAKISPEEAKEQEGNASIQKAELPPPEEMEPQ